jgi:DNA replication licensing factor MCM4
VRLIKVATQSAATDPTTGQIDMDMLHVGMTTDGRKKVNDLVEKVRVILVNLPS